MPLSQKQYAVLSDACLKAWTKQTPEVKLDFERLASEALNDPLVSIHKQREFWRRHWQIKVTGKTSMSDMGQDDFQPMLGCWQELAGEINKSLKTTFVAAPADKQKRAQFILAEELRKAVLNTSYADAIARRQYRVENAAACNEKQTWYLIYTIRNRAKARRDKAAAAGHSEEPRGDLPPIIEPDEAPATAKDDPNEGRW
jgi:hypothetical protein